MTVLNQMRASARREIFELPLPERLQLVEDLWDSIASDGADLPVTSQQREELDRRLANLERDPSSGDSSKNVKSRITRRRCEVPL
jgi:putative addiction module component (TIGR02574 family)